MGRPKGSKNKVHKTVEVKTVSKRVGKVASKKVVKPHKTILKAPGARKPSFPMPNMTRPRNNIEAMDMEEKTTTVNEKPVKNKLTVVDACRFCENKCKIQSCSPNAEMLACPRYTPKPNSPYKKVGGRDADNLSNWKGRGVKSIEN